MKKFIYDLKMKQAYTQYICLFLLCAGLYTSQAQQTFTFNSDATVTEIPDDGYNGSISSMVLKEIAISGIPEGMHYVTSTSGINITHTWVGDLTVKLIDENGFVLGLMSRPGYEETADDGSGCCGSSADFEGNLIFNDDAAVESENINDFGSPIPDMTQVKPSKGAISSPYDSLFDWFGAMPSGGMNGTIWSLGVGDAGDGDDGEFNSAVLVFVYDDYCVPRLDNEYEYITNVTFEGINNDSGSSEGMYPEYFTVDMGYSPAEVSRGGTYPLSVTISPDELEYIYAYFDWNQDGDFDDANETFTVASSVDAPGPHTVDIPVPADAALGETRFRVQLVYNTNTPDPCYVGSDGEVEDYTVNVGPEMGVEDMNADFISLYPNPVVDMVNIASSKENIQAVEIYDVSGKMVQTFKDSGKSVSINVSALPSGMYIAKVLTDEGWFSKKLIKK